MPQARHALYAQGTQLHVALWPGSRRNTEDITRFVAREGRVFCVSASGVLAREDVPDGFPLASFARETTYSAAFEVSGQLAVDQTYTRHHPALRTYSLLRA